MYIATLGQECSVTVGSYRWKLSLSCRLTCPSVLPHAGTQHFWTIRQRCFDRALDAVRYVNALGRFAKRQLIVHLFSQTSAYSERRILWRFGMSADGYLIRSELKKLQFLNGHFHSMYCLFYGSKLKRVKNLINA